MDKIVRGNLHACGRLRSRDKHVRLVLLGCDVDSIPCQYLMWELFPKLDIYMHLIFLNLILVPPMVIYHQFMLLWIFWIGINILVTRSMSVLYLRNSTIWTGMNVPISGVKSLVMQKNVQYEIEIFSLKSSSYRNHPHFKVKHFWSYTRLKLSHPVSLFPPPPVDLFPPSPGKSFPSEKTPLLPGATPAPSKTA